MNKQALSLAVFIAGAYPAASSALGLGDIESSTHLNQPLRAKIDLLSASPADAGQIRVRLASPEVFNRVGVARPSYLEQLRFQSTVQNGRPVILVTSSTPIEEPFVNFLLEVSWPQGQLLKEYTVMLDPPVLMQPGNTLAGEASVRAEPKAAGNIRRQAAPAQAQRQMTSVQPRQAAGNRTYRVRPGDTLFGIAKRLSRPGVSNDRMMMALFRANPNAFINNNINNLRAGALLKAPSPAQVNALAAGEARRQIRQQNAEWRKLRSSLASNTVPQNSTRVAKQPDAAQTAQQQARSAAEAGQDDKARLEVLGADKKGDAAGGAAAAEVSTQLKELENQLSLAREQLTARQKENAELKSRVEDLESMLSKKNRLIDLRNQQLADLQAQLRSATGKEPVVAAGVPDEPAGSGQQNQPDQAAARTQLPGQPLFDEGKDIQQHMANIAGKNDNTVVREAQPADSGAQTETPGQENMPRTPAAMAMGNAGRIPLKPPAEVEKPAEKPVVEPVIPPEPTAGKAEETKPAAVFADEAGGNDDILELLTSPLAMKIGAGSLALLALLWLLGRRRKSDSDLKARKEAIGGDDDIIDLDSELDGNVDLNSLETELKKAEQRQGSDADPFGIQGGDDWEGHGGGQGREPFKPAGGADDLPNDSGMGIGDPEGDEDELLTEANVYIAYGLYQQAESELKKGIEREPDNLEYRHKLLECYFQSNNREAFDAQANQFAAMPGAADSGLWNAIAEWGRKISPDNALYQAGGIAKQGASPSSSSSVASTVAAALGGASAATLAGAAFASDDDDINDDSVAADRASDIDDLDIDLTMDESVQPKPLADSQGNEFGDDLDLGEMDFDDIDLDKLLQGDDFGDEKPSAAVGVDENIALPELDDDSAPALAGDIDDLDTKLDKPLPDLDLDFDLEDGIPELNGSEEEALSHAETGHRAEQDSDDDDLLDLLDDDGDETVVAPPAVQHKAVADSSTHLNLHLDNNNVGRILPKDTFYAPVEGEEQENWLGDIDDALSFLDFPDEEIDLHEAHISTKLDLARAYLDMGDIEGARSTLEEVMVEGNDDQRREAEVLLHQSG